MAKKNNVGIDNLIDNAFVPQAESNKRADNMQGALREEAGAKPNLSLSDLFSKDFKVDANRAGKPEVGLHTVKFATEPEVKIGNNGAYVEFELCDQNNGICWKTFVNADSLEKMLQDISYFNNGVIACMGPMQAITKLRFSEFDCWTLETEKGSTVTYFNETKYNKRIYAMQLNAGNRELKDLRKKEMEDNQARMTEEAAMKNGKVPW